MKIVKVSNILELSTRISIYRKVNAALKLHKLQTCSAESFNDN